ncbi:MAG TPA: FG-GAP-like repeat-containing protein [Kiritimatiellia bacterium]|nr:FG-GAP-like repeat-containing protein [Kiritimatiellia bacterium]
MALIALIPWGFGLEAGAQTNQAPVITFPAIAMTPEGTPFVFSGLNSVSVADPDVGASNMTMRMRVLPPAAGVLSIATPLPAGVTFINATVNNSNELWLQGGITNINLAISSLVYSNALYTNGTFSVGFAANDLGHNGTGGPQVTVESTSMTVTPVNNAPVIALPPGLTNVIWEDTLLTMPITVTDPDLFDNPGAYEFQVSLSATNGPIVIGPTNGLTFTAGDPLVTTGGVIVVTNATFRGPYSLMTNTLAQVVYLPLLDFNGVDTITIQVNDLGNFGTGGPLSTTVVHVVTVLASNDAPTLDLPDFVNGNEGEEIFLGLGGTVDDVDVGEDPLGELLLTLSVTNGTLTFLSTNGLTFTGGANGTTGVTVTASLEDLNVALGSLVYQGFPNFFGFDTLQVFVSDQGFTGAGGVFTDTGTVAIEVFQVNDAPELDSSVDMTLPNILEDDFTNTGATVAAILATGAGGDPIFDPDPGAVDGIAVFEPDNNGGAWEYSINGGVTWTGFGDIFETGAVLLNPAARIRFVPSPDYNGTNTFLFRAWDQTSGANGDTGADSSINGGSTAFSTNVALARIVVLPVNDAPVFTNLTGIALNNQDENDFNPPGTTISNILENANQPLIDIDGDPVGFAVIGRNNTDGVWEYSTDGGGSFAPIGAVGLASSLLLDEDAVLRFIPNPGWFGFADIVVRGWDLTVGTSGQTGVNAGPGGGTSAFSSMSATVTVEVVDINDAPVLDPTGPFTFTPIGVNDFDNPGDSISNVLAGAGTPITDADVNDSQGIAVIAVDTSFGLWQYSLDGGGLWNVLGPASLDAAVLLPDHALVRFVPSPNFGGSATLEFHAWDRSAGSDGEGGVDVSVNGGSTPFSTNSAIASVSMISSNNAPVLDNSVTFLLTTIAENNVSSPGDEVVFIIASPGGDRITDADVGALEGLAVVEVDDANGVWQYSINGGATWLPFGAVTPASAVLLDTSDFIRFVPDPGFFGQATFTFRAWDQTGVQGPGSTGVSTVVNGGTTPFSTAVATGQIIVAQAFVNQAPVLTASGLMALPDIIQNNFTNTGASVAAILASSGGNPISDFDNDPPGLAVVGASGLIGTWQYSTTQGATWNSFFAVSDSSATLLDTNALIRFVPNANQNGPGGTLVVRAWDGSDGYLSGQTGIDASSNGGNTPFSSANDTVTVEVLRMSDLGITQQIMGPVIAGEGMIYRITITNRGPNVATNVVVSASLPPEVEPSDPFVTNLVQVIVGGSQSFLLPVFLPSTAEGALTSTVTAASDYLDAVPADNTSVLVSPVTFSADLAVSVRTQPDQALSGLPWTFVVTVSNRGPSAATQVTVTNTLPGGATFVSTSAGGIHSNGTVSHVFPMLAVNVATTFQFRVTTPSTLGAVVTNLTQALGSEFDPNTTNNLVQLIRTVRNSKAGLDVDGDGRADVAIFNNGVWNFLASLAGAYTVNFGFPGVIPVAGDYDGDGRWDIGVFFPPEGMWYLFRSSLGFTTTQFGFQGTVPVQADYDGDGRTDIAVFHDVSGTWYIFRSQLGFTTIQFGYPGVVPVPADYDGDGRADTAVYDASQGLWYIFRSSLGFFTDQFGFPGTIPVPADYDGDGRADLAVYHPPTGMWYIFRSTLGFTTVQFGFAGTIPVPADYDGDGRADLALYDPAEGRWYLWKSTEGFQTFLQGMPGGLPLKFPAR